jgi:hypothetical protein
MSESASATMTASQVDPSTFGYTITLTDTGQTQIGTFWFAWIPVPDENFLATPPTAVTPPSGWGYAITHNGASDGYGIEFEANSSLMQPGQSLTFGFQSTDSPAAVESASMFYPGYSVTTSWIFQAYPAPGDGDQFVVAFVACFCAGTRIATAAGAIPVEQLCAGDRVMLAKGGLAPVVWLGRRRVSVHRHPCQLDVLPVCVRAGAFGARLPHQDLLLSPDHAIFVDGSLIPARYLVNGSTIVQQRIDEVTYYHVELPAHGVILAEGLACESYLDAGNRSIFESAELSLAVAAGT